ncbi:MAG: hypothetical protein ACRCSC_04065, partial [Lactococcus garvieae]
GIIDGWYDDNIKNTDYEQYVKPVTLANPTLGDKKTAQYGGWTSNTAGESVPGFLATNQPGAFPTVIDESTGKKQAFLMSGSDVSNGQGEYGDLTPEALAHRSALETNGTSVSWLRSAGATSNRAANLTSGVTYVTYNSVDGVHSVVPSLVIHVGE